MKTRNVARDAFGKHRLEPIDRGWRRQMQLCSAGLTRKVLLVVLCEWL